MNALADRPTTDQDQQPAEGTAPEPFIPNTPERVDWVLRKISDHRAAAARIRANGEQMARAEDDAANWLEMKYGAQLQAWARGQIEGTRKRSIRLFNGVLGFRTKPAGVNIGDEAAALKWAREHLPEAVVERLDRKALSDALLSTGEATDFAALVPAEDVFYIKQGREGAAE